MAIPVKFVRVTIPRKTGAIKKYMLRVVASNVVDITSIANIIASRCTVQRPDVEACVIAFCEVVRELLLESRTVKLNKIGTFRVTMQSSGFENVADLSVDSIKKLHVRYLPSTELKESLAKKNNTFKVLNPPPKGFTPPK